MELLNLLNPLYVFGQIVTEIDSSLSAYDMSQPGTWIMIAAGLGAGYALCAAFDPLLTHVVKKMMCQE